MKILKIICVHLLFVCSVISHGQYYKDFNKKELQAEFQVKLDELAANKATIEELQASQNDLTRHKEMLEAENGQLSIQLKAFESEIRNLNGQIEEMNSILARQKIEMTQLAEVNTVLGEFISSNTAKGLNNDFSSFVNDGQNDIWDFLNQFEENNRHTTEIRNETDDKYNRMIEIINYKNGISIKSTYGYENQSYSLYIPMDSEDTVRNGIERLCKNMGGCFGPEEVDVTYEGSGEGLLVTWGGGC